MCGGRVGRERGETRGETRGDERWEGEGIYLIDNVVCLSQDLDHSLAALPPC